MALTLAQKNSIVDIYVGYFNRAPDPTGYQSYIDVFEKRLAESTPDKVITDEEILDTMASNFGNSVEAKALYPFLVTPDVTGVESFLQTVYQNLFNRAPDAVGLKFWTDRINDPVNPMPAGVAIRKISEGAKAGSKDLAILDNKAIVATDYVTKAANIPGYVFDKAGASASIQNVDETAASVTAATAATDASLAGGVAVSVVGTTFTLTTTVGEAIVGTANNDTFSATTDAAGLGATPAPTLNTSDSIDGAGGIDTANLVATSGAAVVPASAVKNVEIVNLISDTGGDGFASANVAAFAGVQQLWQLGATTSTDVTGVTDAVTVGFNAGSVADLQMATGAKTANVALVNVTAGGTMVIAETTAGTLTTADVSGSIAGNGALTIDLDAAGTGTAATAETTVNLGISSNSTINVTSTTAKTVDASKSTGNLTIDVSGTAAATETLKGGSGNDTLTGGAASKLIEGGAGSDTIVAGNVAGEVINGGANGTGTVKLDAITLGGAGQAQTVITNVGESGKTLATADQITNFITTEDKLDFNLVAGSATNFLDGGASSSFTDGLTNANTAFDGTVQYFSTLNAGTTYVFVDSDLDGTADFGVTLAGTAAVVFGDIIA
jgi:hypothetical protein